VETTIIPEMPTTTRSTHRSGRPYRRNYFKEEETSHSLDSSDLSNDEPGSQVELSPVEISESSSTVSSDQRHSDLLSSSSEDNVLLSSALTSIALLRKSCDKLIESIDNMGSLINEPSPEYTTIQGVTNRGVDRNPTGHIEIQAPTHPINALNIQQLDLAYIIRTELTRLEAVIEERVK